MIDITWPIIEALMSVFCINISRYEKGWMKTYYLGGGFIYAIGAFSHALGWL